MQVSYKNLITDINGQDYYAQSVDLSESIEIEYFSALGTKNYSAFPRGKPEGDISMQFYLTTGSEIEAIESGYASTGFSKISIGPFSTDQALLQSFSISSDHDSLITANASYSYYGQINSGVVPDKKTASIKPAHGAASSGDLTGFGINRMLNFSYSFDQSFDVKYSLGSISPSKIVMNGASKRLSVSSLISDLDYEKTSLTGASGLCAGEEGEGFQKKSGYINLNNLCNNFVGSVSINGYMESRDFSSSPGSEVVESIRVTEKYVKDEGCSPSTTTTTTSTTSTTT